MLSVRIGAFNDSELSGSDQFELDEVFRVFIPGKNLVQVEWDSIFIEKFGILHNKGEKCDGCDGDEIATGQIRCLIGADCHLCIKCYHSNKHFPSHPFRTFGSHSNDGNHLTYHLPERKYAKIELARIVKAFCGRSLPEGGFGLKFYKSIKLKSQKSAHAALLIGELAFARKLIQRGMNIDARDRDGDNLLHYAVFGGHCDILQMLIRFGAKLNATNKFKHTALHCACRYSSKECVRILLAAGADYRIRDQKGNTTLHFAAKGDCWENMQLLIGAGADLEALNKSNKTALHLAVAYDSRKCFEILLAAGADPNCEDINGDTPLHVLSGKPHQEMFDLLLRKEPQLDATDGMGRTALHIAVSSNSRKCVELLLEAEANPDCEDINGNTPLHFLCANPQLEVLDLLVRKNVKVDAINGLGRTALHMAVIQNRGQFVEALMGAGADPNFKDLDGNTSLHLAAENTPEMMETLLKAGAKVSEINGKGWTAHVMLAPTGSDEHLQLLLSAGANPNYRTREGDILLHDAVRRKNVERVKMLLKAGAKPNLIDRNGNAPLHIAIQRSNYLQMIDVLCSAEGINFGVRNKLGHNPLQHAAAHGNEYAVEKILSINSDKQFVDARTEEDGFSALHLVQNNKAIVEMLINKGGANIELRSRKGHTPLHQAIIKRYLKVIEILIQFRADLNAVNDNGNTCIDMALAAKRNVSEHELDQSPTIKAIYDSLPEEVLDTKCGIAISCYLLKHGTDYNANKSAIQHLDANSRNVLRSYKSQVECNFCMDFTDENVYLEPCKHSPACVHCTSFMMKCMICGVSVNKKIREDGTVLQEAKNTTGDERVTQLEMKLAEYQKVHESLKCSLCKECRKNIMFICGHGTCFKCADTLTDCHECGSTITRKIIIY
ncbi:PREDICTED: tankyrase-1-like [Nicrophorus vespilloides]|uniref:Tankyrase-1-like n=1 Tax=Nicrophorus vespilloides TaxID=110193 RepID=A0ABM1NI92_NICVS|nr:PREDICTED: tankyrase-1-like [Nicrophorus vespilloides]